MANRKLTKRGTKRRDQVMDTSLRLFADQGYHGTTVGDICDTLGVGKGVFYWYFESKEALFTELLQECLLKLRRAQRQEIEKVTQPVARIEHGIRASIDFFRDTPAFLSLIRTAARYEEFAALVAHGQEIVVSDVAVHVKEGQAQGTIRHGDPDLMAHGILGTVFHFVETYFGNDTQQTADRPQLADEAVAFCLHGVLTGSAL
jgi:AcrR family transcriptional regulator